MSMWELYWLTRLHPVGKFFGLLAFVFFVILMILAFYMTCRSADGEDIKDESQVFKKVVICTLFCSFAAILTPSNKDIAIILGGYWVSNSEEVKKLPVNVVKTVNDFLEKYQDDEEKEE